MKQTNNYQRIELPLPTNIIDLQEILARLWYGYFRPRQPLSLTDKRYMREDYNLAATEINKMKPGSVIMLTESTKWTPTKMYESDEAQEMIEEDARITTGQKKEKIVQETHHAHTAPATKGKAKGKSAVRWHVDHSAPKRGKAAPPAKRAPAKKKPAPATRKAAPAKKKKTLKKTKKRK